MNDRLSQLRTQLSENTLDAVLISSNPNIIYFTQFNHFTPLEREAFLFITKNHNYILTDKRYSHAVKKHIKNSTLCELTSDHPFSWWIEKFCREEAVTTLGVEEINLTLSEYKQIKPYVKKIVSWSAQPLRMIKSPEEIDTIYKACQIGDKAFNELLAQINTPMTEKDIALLLELSIKKQQAALSFETIVAIQENAAFIHHKTGKKKLTKNNLILLDFGVLYDNYCSDISRTVCFGKATKKQKKAYKTVLAAQEKAITYIQEQLSQKEKISAGMVDQIAREHITEQGYESFAHSLGHGIGLEVHESPRISPFSKELLTEGMIFSIEPGVYLPNNFGIRIEDLFAIHHNKLVQLTNAPRELIEI